MSLCPGAEVSANGNFSGWVRIVVLQAIVNGVVRLHVIECGFVDVETKGLRVRITGFKLHIASVGDKFVDHGGRGLRVKRDVATESRNQNVCANRRDARDMAPQNPQIAPFHD